MDHRGRGINLIYSPLDVNPAPFAHVNGIKRVRIKLPFQDTAM